VPDVFGNKLRLISWKQAMWLLLLLPRKCLAAIRQLADSSYAGYSWEPTIYGGQRQCCDWSCLAAQCVGADSTTYVDDVRFAFIAMIL